MTRCCLTFVRTSEVVRPGTHADHHDDKPALGARGRVGAIVSAVMNVNAGVLAPRHGRIRATRSLVEPINCTPPPSRGGFQISFGTRRPAIDLTPGTAWASDRISAQGIELPACGEHRHQRATYVRSCRRGGEHGSRRLKPARPSAPPGMAWSSRVITAGGSWGSRGGIWRRLATPPFQPTVYAGQVVRVDEWGSDRQGTSR